MLLFNTYAYSLLLILFVFVIPSKASSNDLMNATSYECKYDIGSTPNIENGRFKTEIKNNETMKISFDSINHKTSTAIINGNNGQEKVMIVTRDDNKAISFIEITYTGNIIVTTIYNTKNNHNNFFSSHSRNISLGGHPIPSQWYGSCMIK